MNAIRLLTAAVLLGFAGLTSIAIAQEPAAAADSNVRRDPRRHQIRQS